MDAFDAPHSAEIGCLVPTDGKAMAQGFLQLPSQSHEGRLRMVDDVPGLASTDEISTPVPIILQDGAGGTPGAILDGFTTRHLFSAPIPTPFPLTVHVNTAITGTEDATVTYRQATVRSSTLVDFFEPYAVAPDNIARGRELRSERATGDFGACRLTAHELAQREDGERSISLKWSAELTLDGPERPLADWSDPLHTALSLFAFLLDRPVGSDRVYAIGDDGIVDYHAQWQTPAAPDYTFPLLTSRQLESMTIDLGDVIERWALLADAAPSFVLHVREFQSHRDRHMLDGKVLLLARVLELYHAYAKRFASTLQPKPQHRHRVKRILAALPDSFADDAAWIKRALRQANRKHLAAQIGSIVDDLGPDVRRACGIDDQGESFADIVTATRNHYTHPKKKKLTKVPEGIELFTLIHRLWFVVRACVLLELGFERTDIARALNGSAQRHYTVHR